MLTRVLLTSALFLGFLALSPAHSDEKGLDNPKRNPYLAKLAGKKVIFVPQARGIDLVEAWVPTMQKQAAKYGYTIDVRDPNWSVDAGARIIESAIGEKPDLLIVHNSDIQSYVRLYKRAEQAGIRVLQLNMESAYPTDGYVGADWVNIGQQLAQRLVDRCSAGNGPSTKIAIMQGVPTGAADIYQMHGMYDVLGKHPEIKVVSQQSTGYDASKANSIMSTVLQQHPDLCGAMGIWDSMDVGTGSAVNQAGKQGKVYVVTSGGGSQTSCENIDRGIFSAYLSFNAPLQGDLVNERISELLESDKPPGQSKTTFFTPLTWIEKADTNKRNCWSLDDVKTN